MHHGRKTRLENQSSLRKLPWSSYTEYKAFDRLLDKMNYANEIHVALFQQLGITCITYV